MMVIRHAEPSDLEAIYRLAIISGIGLTSLPADKNSLQLKLERIHKTRYSQLPKHEQGYLFVLEDTSTQQIVGVSGIEVQVGMDEPFYNFQVNKQVHASKALNVYQSLNTLFLSNNYTGSSELCTLFLEPAFRKNLNGKFLSKIRFLFIASFQNMFSSKLIAEMRGYSDEDGNSPFWSALGQHFFNMPFSKADYLSGTGQKVFIAELMPRFPIYIDLLPASAQNIIGQVHEQTRPAFHMLEKEGLKYQGYIDIFDAGPTLECDINDLRAVKQCHYLKVNICEKVNVSDDLWMVANHHYESYRAILINHSINENTINLNAEQACALNVDHGHQVCVLKLNPQEV